MKQLSVFAALLLASSLTLGGCKSSQPRRRTGTRPEPRRSSQHRRPELRRHHLSTGAAVRLSRSEPVRPEPGPGSPTIDCAHSRPRSSSRSPAGSTAASGTVAFTAPAGTRVLIRTTESLSASHNEVGDGFSGVLDAPIVARGATLFARGTRVTGTVVAAKGRGRFKGAGALGIELNTIAGLRVQTNEYEREVKGKGKRTGALIGGGGGLGALIGGIAGGSKGALIGGLAGAGAGTAGAAYTGNKDVVLPSESLITFHLTAPVTVRR